MKEKELDEKNLFSKGGIIVTRKAMGLAQKEFAKIIGYSPIAISRWERGIASPQKARRAMILESLRNYLENPPVVTTWSPGWLRNERLSRNLTQGEFAQALGVDGITISRWERGITSPKSISNIMKRIKEM